MKLKSFNELVEQADMDTIYVKVKPIIIDESDVNPSHYKKHSVVRVFDQDSKDFANKSICTDNSIFFLVQPTERVEFSEKGNTHIFEPYEMIMVSPGDQSTFNKWKFERIDDVVNFSSNFESVDYGQYANEKSSLDSLKSMKAEFLKTNLENEYSTEKQKLSEKSSISIKFPSFKKSN